MNMMPERNHGRDHRRTEANTALCILGESEPEQAHYRNRSHTAMGYPYPSVSVYMILSCLCIMWNMTFVAAFTAGGSSWHGAGLAQPKQAKTHHVPVKPFETRHTSIVKQARASEIVLSEVPAFAIQSEKRGRHRYRHRHRHRYRHHLRKSMRNKKGIAFTAPASPTTPTTTSNDNHNDNDNTDPELRSRLTTMLENENEPLSLLGDDLVIAIVIADSGCTMASSFDPLDFEGPIIPLYPVTRLQGIVGSATVEIRGRGTIQWTVIDDSGTSRVIRTPGYYVPDMHVRLFSPQAYMRDPESACEEFRLSADAATLSWSSDSSRSGSNSDTDLRVHTLTIPYDDVTGLPRMRAYRNRNLTESTEVVAAGASFLSATDAYLHSVEVDHAAEARLADRAAATPDEQEDWRASWMHAWRSR
jgi:hypothetical protein